MNQEWQPIETAPKDGTDVLLFLQNLRVCIGSYNINESFTNGELNYRYEGWNTGMITILGNETPQPTHWMPVPSGPNVKVSG